MNFKLFALLSVAGLFFGMMIFSEIGRRIGIAKQTESDTKTLTEGAGAVEAAVFGLLGLLLAFTFSGAASKFEDRRHLITAEANAIGTAYLRIDLLPTDAQSELRELFRRYVEVRSTTYRNMEDMTLTKAKLVAGTVLQEDIWKKALIASRRPDASSQAIMLLIPALNEMIDITTTRVVATRNHPPIIIFLLLGGLSLVGAMLFGYSTSANKKRSWFHTVIFATFLSLTVFVIVDLEFPRLGLIRIDVDDQLLTDLRTSMQ